MSECHHYSESGIEAEDSRQDNVADELQNQSPNWNDVSEIWNTPVEELPPPPIGKIGTIPVHSSIPSPFDAVSTSNLPPVYPYLPSPTLQLEDTRRKSEPGFSHRVLPESPASQLNITSSTSTTTELQLSPSASTPPTTVYSTTDCMHFHNSPWSTKTRISNEEDSSASPGSTKGTDKGHGAVRIDDYTATQSQSSVPRCSSTYVKGVLCTSHDREWCHCHLLHGQVWQGGIGKGKWRRNQWVLERTLSVGAQSGETMQ
jgi:hypothetical protein